MKLFSTMEPRYVCLLKVGALSLTSVTWTCNDFSVTRDAFWPRPPTSGPAHRPHPARPGSVSSASSGRSSDPVSESRDQGHDSAPLRIYCRMTVVKTPPPPAAKSRLGYVQQSSHVTSVMTLCRIPRIVFNVWVRNPILVPGV